MTPPLLASPGIDIDGDCEPGFRPVRDEFVRNFTSRGELGAACAVYRRGEKIVDLWGGVADRRRGRPWREDTLVLMFSTTKGAAAAAVALANSRGLIDYDAAVADYWPEFGRNGKSTVRVRQLLAHQAGLPALAMRLDAATIGDRERLSTALADQRPAWKPGTRHGYHALTIGWYQSELIRRVDPAGRSLGRFFQEEVAGPLGLEFYIGLPRDVAPERLARLASFHPARALAPGAMPRRMLAALGWPSSLTARTLRNPRLRSPAELARPEYRVLEIPAGGGTGQVRSVAKLYGELACGGHALGLSDRTRAELIAAPRTPSRGPFDQVLKVDTAYSLGFVRPNDRFRFGASDRAFGHPGAGGSFAFADPDEQLGFAYAPNRLGYHLANDPRERALREAVYRCL